MRMLSVGVVGCALLLASAVVGGHHSFSAEFDIDQPVTLKGTLTELEWVNPHGWIHMDVASENLRVVERYTLVDDDTLRYEATLEDPTVFTRPWTLRFDMGRIGRDGEYEFFEEACSEGLTNEHRLAAGRQAVARGERYIHTHEGP